MPDNKQSMQATTSTLPLIRLSAVNPFLMELAKRNVDGGAILRSHGMPDVVPASSDLFVSPISVYEVVEESAFAADDPFIGFKIGEQLDLAQWEPIARAVQDAKTVGDLLRYFVVNALEHSSSTDFFVRTKGDRTTFGLNRVVVPPFRPAQNDAFYFGIFSKLLRQSTGEHWDASKVLANIAMPAVVPTGADYPRVAEGDSKGIRISFPTSWQFAPFKKSAVIKATAFESGAGIPGSLVDSVRAALRPHIHRPDLTVERAAKICGYEKRRLGRLLRKQGTTIVKEIAAVREASARDKLEHSSLRVAEIGQSVGFPDPTVFSRAFKNWTGQSPQQFRRTHRT